MDTPPSKPRGKQPNTLDNGSNFVMVEEEMFSSKEYQVTVVTQPGYYPSAAVCLLYFIISKRHFFSLLRDERARYFPCAFLNLGLKPAATATPTHTVRLHRLHFQSVFPYVGILWPSLTTTAVPFHNIALLCQMQY